MLRYELIHPEILAALGSAGHGAKVLIADGNYPFATQSNVRARRVFLNLTPGKLLVTDVLEVLLSAIDVESAQVMMPGAGEEPPIFGEFRNMLPSGVALTSLGRQEFYETACGRDICLVVATGEQRLFANLLLTIGALSPPSASGGAAHG